jgi:hypothetical protein
MAKLFCSRVTGENNTYKEDMITEIPEKVFIVDGYSIADRMLEGVPFCIYFDDSGVTKIDFETEYTKNWFKNTFNSKKWYKEVKKYAESILEEGDEVDVPKFIKDKYFKDGINVAYIINENA